MRDLIHLSGARMDRIDVHGLTIAYERAGEGPPLVLLHGYVGDGRTTWHRQIDALCDRFTVVAWDAPGAGRSPSSCDRRREPPRRDSELHVVVLQGVGHLCNIEAAERFDRELGAFLAEHHGEGSGSGSA